MTVVVNEAAVNRLLNSTVGPVGIYIAHKASEVQETAQANASGPVIGIETGALIGGLRTQMEGSPEGVRAVVSTDAVARYTTGQRKGQVRPYQGSPFSYPAYHDQHDRPWLTNALRQVFPG